MQNSSHRCRNTALGACERMLAGKAEGLRSTGGEGEVHWRREGRVQGGGQGH